MTKSKSLVFLLFLFNLGIAAAQSTITISDYPAHVTSVASLTPDKQQSFRRFALGLVGAAFTGVAVDVTIIGQAHFDAQGRVFEVTVSRDPNHISACYAGYSRRDPNR